jgi:hypothetical protein
MRDRQQQNERCSELGPNRQEPEDRGPAMSQTSGSNGCAQCSSLLPENRTRFCSDACTAQWKRERERDRYGHRHRFECVECGRALHLGRRRK